MKIREVIWRPKALDDIENILVYIAQDNPNAAINALDKIDETGNNLGKMALGHRGRMDDIYEIGVSGLPYTIAYIIDKDIRGVEIIAILRVIHQTRNWTKNKWPE